MSKQPTRADLMRALHGLAKQVFQMEDPHPILHQLAVSEFEVESMSHISVKEIEILMDKIKNSELDWKKVETLGVTRIPEMTINQQMMVKKLQKELNWSDEYLIEIAIRRYGYLHWKYLTGREAFAFCEYLIRRRREKLLHERETKKKQVAA